MLIDGRSKRLSLVYELMKVTDKQTIEVIINMSFILENAVMVLNIVLLVFGLIAIIKPIVGFMGMGISIFTVITLFRSYELHEFMINFSIITLFIVVLCTMYGLGRNLRNV